MKLIKKVNIRQVISRKMRSLDKAIKYMNKDDILTKPIIAVYIQSIKKYVVLDGHNRLLARRLSGKKKITIKVFGYQKKVTYRNGLPIIDYKKLIKYGNI